MHGPVHTKDLCILAQVIAWSMVATLSVLIVASRKHYTVDVVIAWYVVPLVFYAMLRRWTTKRPVSEEPWPHRSLAEDNALQLEEIVVHSNAAAPEVRVKLFLLCRLSFSQGLHHTISQAQTPHWF